MPTVTASDVLFSAKMFAAALLALYVAFSLDLSSPGWSALTVVIVSQPNAGMVVAKATFRVVGTCVGAIAAVVLVGAFAQVPALFLIGLAAWIGACLFVSVLLRDRPAAYGAMLAGYSAAIIGVPASQDPLTTFDTGMSRCLEITLGILCATIVHRTIMPRTSGQALGEAIARSVAATRAWAADVLNDRTEGRRGLTDRAALLADVASLEQLRTFAAIDTPGVRGNTGAVRALQSQLLRLVANMISVRDRAAVARADAPDVLVTLAPLMRDADVAMQAQLAEDAAPEVATLADTRARIAAHMPRLAALVADPRQMLTRNILLRLDDTLAAALHIAGIRRDIAAGVPRRGPSDAVARYRDYPLASVSAAVGFISLLATALFWIGSAWSSGPSALLFVGVITSIVATLDDPVASARSFLIMTVGATVVAAIYLFWVFPITDDFAGMAVALMVFLLPVGTLMAVPGVGPTILPLALNTMALIGFTNGMAQTDFASFANGAIGLVGGIGAGIVCLLLLRPIGVDWTIERMRLGLFSDIARQATARRLRPRGRFAGIVLDRINTLLPRLTVDSPGHADLLEGMMAGLRIGLNITELQLIRRTLPPAVRTSVDAALAGLAAHFRLLSAGRAAGRGVPELEVAVVAVMAEARAMGQAEPAGESASGAPDEQTMMALVSLTAIARGLQRHGAVFGVPAAEPEPVTMTIGAMP